MNKALRSRRKFLRIFPGGFADPDYIEIESCTNLLFSFEKMALRDAVPAPGRRPDLCPRFV